MSALYCFIGLYFRYRRIAGDKCVIDKNIENSYFLPQMIPCPIPGIVVILCAIVIWQSIIKHNSRDCNAQNGLTI